MTQLAHRRLRAPIEDGTALIDPPIGPMAELMESNREITKQFQRASGFPPTLAESARKLLLDPPRIFVDPADNIDTRRPIVLTGHQPELFHAGVWFKNFLAASIADRCGAYAANLIVDNDLIRTPGLRVPTPASLGPRITEVLFDDPLDEMTWENRYLSNSAVFRGFADEVRRRFQTFMVSGNYANGMILDEFWPAAVAAFDQQDESFREFADGLADQVEEPANEYPPFGLLADCFTAARRRLEKNAGISLHDCAISVIAMQQPFLEFSRLLLLRSQELREIYNRSLVEYRAVNGVRSHSHPFPALASDDEWLEIPLWISTFADPRRRRAFVRVKGNNFELTDRDRTSISVPQNASTEFGQILMRNEVRLRPRAIVTTMYARLVLSDLFIHGIGGAKYDELTDIIIRRFFGIEPPAYVTATATFRLPIERPHISVDDVRRSAQRIRDVRYRPESFLNEAAIKQDSALEEKLAALALEKRDYLGKHDLLRCSSDVFKHLNSLNRVMHDLLQPVEQELRARHAELIALARQSQLLGSREFSFVLFPAEKLSAQLLALSETIS
jgi:hypothetical protein